MNLTRRKFFGAAIAAPVAAKEAAKKMSLESVMSPAKEGTDLVINSATPPMGIAEAEIDWARRGLATLDSPREEAQRSLMAKHQARILDADLAALRSMSPSAAYTLQRQRTAHWLRESRRADYVEALAQAGKRLGKSLLAL